MNVFEYDDPDLIDEMKEGDIFIISKSNKRYTPALIYRCFESKNGNMFQRYKARCYGDYLLNTRPGFYDKIYTKQMLFDKYCRIHKERLGITQD